MTGELPRSVATETDCVAMDEEIVVTDDEVEDDDDDNDDDDEVEDWDCAEEEEGLDRVSLLLLCSFLKMFFIVGAEIFWLCAENGII